MKLQFIHSGLTAKVLRATSVIATARGLTMLCGVLRNKLIALWMSPAAIGLNGLLTTAQNFIAQSTQLGISASGVREVAVAPAAEQNAKAALVVRWGLVLGAFGALMCLLLAAPLSLLTFGNWQQWWMFVVLAPAIFALGIATGCTAALQGLQQIKLIAKLSVWSIAVLTLAAIPLFYWLRYQSIVWVVSLASVLVGAFFWFGTRSYIRGVPTPPLRQGWPMIKLGITLMASSMLTLASGYIILAYLNHVASEYEVGLYQAAYAILTNYLGILITSLGYEFYPRLSAQIAHPRRVRVLVRHELRVMMWICVAVLPPMALLRNWLIDLLYSAEFRPAAVYLLWALPGAGLRLISNTIAFIMLAKADSRAYMVLELGSAMLGLICAIGGYTLDGLRGMGIGYTLWYAAYTAAVWAVYKFRYKL